MKYTYIVLSLLFILLFDLWVENSTQAKSFYKNWLQPFLDDWKISVFWLMLPMVAIIILIRNWSNRKEEEIEGLKTTLESEMEILVHANTELSKYRLEDNMSKFLSRFVNRYPFVIAVQLYHFSEQHLNLDTTFKASFNDGKAVEGVNINAIHQLYYKVESKYVRRFRKAKRVLEEEENPNLLLDFVLDTYSLLHSKTEDSLGEEDACLCSLMILGLEILERDYQLGIESLGKDEGKFHTLMNDYRTGIFRGTFMNDAFYTFTHTRKNEKLNRQYLTRKVEVRNEETLFLIALDAGILEEEEYDRLMVDISEGFENLLIELERVYNKTIERTGEENGNER
jgi:hypothetical protein